MCQRTECPVCKKPTFRGCGRHVEQVLGDVPPAERCQCNAKEKSSAAAPSEGFVRRLFRL